MGWSARDKCDICNRQAQNKKSKVDTEQALEETKYNLLQTAAAYATGAVVGFAIEDAAIRYYNAVQHYDAHHKYK